MLGLFPAPVALIAFEQADKLSNLKREMQKQRAQLLRSLSDQRASVPEGRLAAEIIL